MRELLLDSPLALHTQNFAANNMCRVHYATAFILGEFSKTELKKHEEIIVALLRPQIVNMEMGAVFLHGVLKLLVSTMSCDILPSGSHTDDVRVRVLTKCLGKSDTLTTLFFF